MVLALSLLVTPALAVVGPAGMYEADALVLAQDLGAVGLLDDDSCGVVLVGERAALTLASCVVGRDAADVELLLGDGSDLDRRGVVEAISRHPDWSAEGPFTADLAVLRLAAPVAGVTPVPVARWNPVGDRGRIVGFGPWGTTASLPAADAGPDERHGVENAIDHADADEGLLVDQDDESGASNSLWLEYGVQSGATGLDAEGVALAGDLGAALLVPGTDGLALAGLFHRAWHPDELATVGTEGTIAAFVPLSDPDTLSFLAGEGVGFEFEEGSETPDTGDPADTGAVATDGDRTGFAGGQAACSAAPAASGLAALLPLTLAAIGVLRRREDS